jgi:hypothetical protein
VSNIGVLDMVTPLIVPSRKTNTISNRFIFPPPQTIERARCMPVLSLRVSPVLRLRQWPTCVWIARHLVRTVLGHVSNRALTPSSPGLCPKMPHAAASFRPLRSKSVFRKCPTQCKCTMTAGTLYMICVPHGLVALLALVPSQILKRQI